MTTEELKKRLKVFALRIIKLSESLPNNTTGKTLGNQIIRSGTSPGANYRSACLGKSDKDFLNKLKMVEEELDETLYWLELIVESAVPSFNSRTSLILLLSPFATGINTFAVPTIILPLSPTATVYGIEILLLA